MTRKKKLLTEAKELLAEAREGRTADGDDVQLYECLPLAVALEILDAWERAGKEGRKAPADADLLASARAILAEGDLRPGT
jgi:hypothetical protein